MFRRRRHQEEEGESIFVSMTDLTVSILMIVIILLGFFASQMRDVQTLEQLVSLKDILVERDQQIADQSEEIAALQAALNAEESARRRFETLYETAIAEIEALKQSQVSLQADLGDASAANIALEEEKLLLQSEYDVLLKSLEVSTVENERLRKSVESLTEKLTDAPEQFASVENRLAEAEEKAASLSAEVVDLKLAVSVLEENRVELLALRDSLRDELETTQQALAASERQVAKLHSDVASRDRLAEELGTQIAGLEAELAEARDDAAELSNALDNERLQRENAEAAHNAALAENAAQREEISEFKYQIAVLEGERDALVTAREALVVERDDLQSEITGRDAALADLQRELELGRAGLEAVEAEHAAAIAGLEAEITAKNAEIDNQIAAAQDSQGEIAKLQATLEIREAALSETSAELATTQQALSDQQAQVAALERLQGNSVSAVADLERAMEVLRFDLQQSLKSLGEAASVKQGLEGQIDALQIEIATLTGELSSLEGKLADAATTHDGLEAELADLTTSHAEVSAELNAVQSTASVLLNELQDNEAIRAELTARSNALSNDLSAATDRIADLEDNLNAEITQRTDVEAQLAEAISGQQQTLESLNSTFEELGTTQVARDLVQTQLDEVSELLATREEELASTVEQRDAARNNASALSSRLAVGDESFQDLQKQFQIQRIILMLRQARFDRTAQENVDLKAKLTTADAEVVRLQAELDALLVEADDQTDVEASPEETQ